MVEEEDDKNDDNQEGGNDQPSAKINRYESRSNQLKEGQRV